MAGKFEIISPFSQSPKFDLDKFRSSLESKDMYGNGQVSKVKIKRVVARSARFFSIKMLNGQQFGTSGYNSFDFCYKQHVIQAASNAHLSVPKDVLHVWLTNCDPINRWYM